MDATQHEDDVVYDETGVTATFNGDVVRIREDVANRPGKVNLATTELLAIAERVQAQQGGNQ